MSTCTPPASEKHLTKEKLNRSNRWHRRFISLLCSPIHGLQQVPPPLEGVGVVVDAGDFRAAEFDDVSPLCRRGRRPERHRALATVDGRERDLKWHLPL